jgi:hypothetical protein
MGTSIIEIARAEGMAKRGDEWFPLSQAVVARASRPASSELRDEPGAVFPAHPPNLPPRSLMTSRQRKRCAVDFAVICPLVRPGRPHIRFLSIRSRFCSTLPSDLASRRRPCASLTLRRHQAG